MKRLLAAYRNSVRAFWRLSRTEAAFQQELMCLAAAIPLGWFVSSSWRGYGLLLASIVFLMVVEVLNTGIEAACNAVSREFNLDIQLAKDCGSLAVLLALVIVLGIWGMAVVERIVGLPV